MAVLIPLVAIALALLVAGNLAYARVPAGDGPAPPSRARSVAGVGEDGHAQPVPASLLWFLATTALYLVVGAYLVLHRGSVVGDAQARVAQAWYVVASRDPHLGAIGFVWNPLPSALAIPLVALRGIWPPLATEGFAGCVISAVAMGAAVVQLRAALRQLGPPPTVAVVLTLAFALNPMTIYYGGNGMSEALYLLFLIATARHLVAWTATGSLRSLAWAGVHLGLAYLTRYEAAAAAGAVAIVVLTVGTVARGRDRTRRARLDAAVADVVVVLFPFAVAFTSWAIVSWLITGQPFEQFTSRYGNASILRAAGGTGGANGTGWPKAVLVAVQAQSYAPLLVPVVIVAVVVGWRRRDRRFLGLVALLAPVGFSAAAYSTGQTFGFLRYYVPVLPAFLLAVALLWTPVRGMRPAVPMRLARGGTATAAAVLVALTCVAGSAAAMASPRIGPGEYDGLAWVVRPARDGAEREDAALLSSTRAIAADVDRLGLTDGSVAVDTFDCGSEIVLHSAHPHSFVITSDRDFDRAVAAPLAFHVRYFLVPNGDEGIEAISLAHPHVYDGGEQGAFVTRVVGEYRTQGCPTYRLLRIVRDGS